MANDGVSPQTGRVVAATDGSPEATRGVRFAAHEATRLDAVLHVVHVIPGYLQQGGSHPIFADGSPERRGGEVLDTALDVVRQAEPDVRTTSALVAGRRVTRIAEESAGADLLVVAARDIALLQRVWTGSTIVGVTARASCPVLVLPASFDHDRPPRGRVTVGVKDTEHADTLLETAFVEAEARDSGVLVVHAWRLSSGYDDIIVGRVADQTWDAMVAGRLDEAVARQSTARPGVAVERQVVHGQAARVLVEASHDCDRLVVSKPTHGGVAHHLGGTLRALLREATCPVLVVPHETA